MDDTDKLYAAVQEYIEGRNGKVIVIGGVQISRYQHDPEHKYSFIVNFLGRKPSVQTNVQDGSAITCAYDEWGFETCGCLKCISERRKPHSA